jgi:hypothetical protein
MKKTKTFDEFITEAPFFGALLAGPMQNKQKPSAMRGSSGSGSYGGMPSTEWVHGGHDENLRLDLMKDMTKILTVNNDEMITNYKDWYMSVKGEWEDNRQVQYGLDFQAPSLEDFKFLYPDYVASDKDKKFYDKVRGLKYFSEH